MEFSFDVYEIDNDIMDIIQVGEKIEKITKEMKEKHHIEFELEEISKLKTFLKDNCDKFKSNIDKLDDKNRDLMIDLVSKSGEEIDIIFNKKRETDDVLQKSIDFYKKNC